MGGVHGHAELALRPATVARAGRSHRHGRQLQVVEALGGHRGAQQAAGVPDQKRHRGGGGVLGGADQHAGHLLASVIDDQNGCAAGQLPHCGVNAVRRDRRHRPAS
jgi:hypothetical protein